LDKWAFYVVAALAVVAASVAGCGGGGDSSTGIAVTPGSLSKAEFVKRANQICKAGIAKSQTQAVAFVKEHKLLEGPHITREEAASIIDSVWRPIYLQEAREIAALGPPKSDVSSVAEIVAAIEADIEADKANPLKVVQSGKIVPTAKQKAEAYGLALCRSAWV
jgi:hypothetical protein